MSRLDYGKKYCHESPTLDEVSLQNAILAALNSRIGSKNAISEDISRSLEQEVAPLPGEGLSLADIERRMQEISDETRNIVAQMDDEDSTEEFMDRLVALKDEASELKERRTFIQEQRQSNEQALQRLTYTHRILEEAPACLDTWDESLIRQLVDSIKVVSADKIVVYLRTGEEIEQEIHD